MGAIDGAQWVAVAVLIASTLLNAGYFMPVVFRAFFRKPTGRHHGEAPLPILIAIVITAAGTVALFFYPDIPLDLALALVAD
jgi:multicomponent Na+:H+ antiporter subunit D